MYQNAFKKAAESFKTYEQLYDLLKNSGYDVPNVLSCQLNKTIYPELDWMLEYFQQKEEYEKCIILKHLKKQYNNYE